MAIPKICLHVSVLPRRATVLALAAMMGFTACKAIGQPIANSKPEMERGYVDLAIVPNQPSSLSKAWQESLEARGIYAMRLAMDGRSETWRFEARNPTSFPLPATGFWAANQVSVVAASSRPAVRTSSPIASTSTETTRQLREELAALNGLANPSCCTGSTGDERVSVSKVDLRALRLLTSSTPPPPLATQFTAAASMSGNFDSLFTRPSPTSTIHTIPLESPPTTPLPTSFTITIAGDELFAYVKEGGDDGTGGWNLTAGIAGNEHGYIRMQSRGDTFQALAEVAGVGYVMVGDANGEAVSARFDLRGQDHPSADTARSDGSIPMAGNRCLANFTDKVDIPATVVPGDLLTIDVVLAAQREVKVMLGGVSSLFKVMDKRLEAQGIPIKFNVVYEAVVDYTPGCGETDACWYKMCDDLVEGNGSLARLHELRTDRGADIIVLLVNNSHFNGLAADIGASADRAFIVLGVTGAFQNSLAHEITHLAGGLHNVECSERVAHPRHGLVALNGGAGTIMVSSCDANTFTGDRELTWAKQGAKFVGGTSAEDETCCGEARVFFGGAARISKFYNPRGVQ